MNQRHRPDLELGDLDQIEGLDPVGARPSGERPRSPAWGGQRPSRRRMGLLIGFGALAVLALVVFVHHVLPNWRSPISETRALLEMATIAEREQRWTGSHAAALPLYRRILETDPDNTTARDGLRRVAGQLWPAVETAIDRGDWATAQAHLDELSAAGEAGDRIAALRRRLERQRSAGEALETLLVQAESAQAQGLLLGDTGALAAFERMLAIDPGNAVAERGVADALSAMGEQATAAIGDGDIEEGRRLIEAIAAKAPQHASLPVLGQALAAAEAAAVQAHTDATVQAERALRRERQRTQREGMAAVRRGDRARRDGRYADALVAYRQALELLPAEGEALDGLTAVGESLLDQAQQALREHNPGVATAALTLARRAQADPDRVAAAEADLNALNRRLASAVLTKPPLDAATEATINVLMTRARAAEQRGDLAEPAGDSAFDLYRQVLRIDPTHDAARQATDGLPRRAQAMAVHHIELAQPDRAQVAYDALRAIAPLDTALAPLRQQLTEAWLAFGREALSRGEMAPARQALERARQLEPDHPGVLELAVALTARS